MKRAHRPAAAAAVAAVAAMLAACGGGSHEGSAVPAAGTSAGPTTRTAAAVPSAGTSAGNPAGSVTPDKTTLVNAPGATATSTTQRDAVRLADQATFGATEALITSIRGQGVEAWLAAQFAATGSSYTSGNGNEFHINDNGDFCNGRGSNCWRDWFSTDPLVWDFYRNAMTQPDQLRQRVAFALGQIVVVSSVEVSGTYGFRNYHNMLLTNAFGSYREVLRRVTLSPVMGEYLDHVNNNRLSPNENFARELLQLFAIGTCRLNADGTLEGGRCLPTYDNGTVRNYAFALTGWTYPAGGSTVWGCWPSGANCPFFGGDMVPVVSFTDNQSRALLSNVSVPASRTATAALNSVLDSLMNHPSMAPFIGRQLIQHLVKSNPTPGYVQRVAAAFTSGTYQGLTRSFGTGVRGDLGATVAAILLDAEARTSAPPLVAEKLREPALLMTGVMRALNGNSDGAAMGWWWGETLRQHLFRAPSVFNYYSPTYPVAGTPLVGPAFGIYNVNTAFSRLNYLNQLLHWGGMGADSSVPGATGSQVNLSAFEADAADATLLVNRLANLATGGRMTASAKASVVTAVNAWTSAQSANWRTERVRTAAYLVFASPAYQVLN